MDTHQGSSSAPSEKLILYMESLVNNKALIEQELQSHQNLHVLPRQKRDIATIPIIIALEEIILRSVPPDVKVKFTSESLRLDVVEHISFDGMREELRLLFLDEVQQALHLYAVATQNIIHAIILLAGIDGLREILKKVPEGVVVSESVAFNGDFDTDIIYKYIIDSQIDDIEPHHIVHFFKSIYKVLYNEVSVSFGKELAVDSIYETFQFLKSHYNKKFVNLFIRVLPDAILQNKVFLNARKDDLQKRVMGQAQEINETSRTLVKRNQELLKMRGQLERRIVELDQTTKNLIKNDKALRKSTETIELLLKSINDGIIATDRSGRVTLINESAQKMIGWYSQDIVGKNWSDLVVVEDKEGVIVPSHKLPIFQVLEHGTTVSNSDYYYVRRDGTKLPVTMTVSPIVNDTLVGAVITFRDATKEREVERTKSTFVSVAAHQLRTPITAIWS